MGAAAAAVMAAVAQGDTPKFKEGKWKRFAGALAKIQHGKCGYCESKVTCVTDPDVEHFSPKSEVSFLSDDPKDWGTDELYLPRLKGRRKKVLAKRGYWWLAYCWENYLLACGVCNRKWKLTLFPVADTNRTLPPQEGVLENILLLNPFAGPHPADHLMFDNIGSVRPHNGSRHGWETIKTCGLDRPALRESRLEKAHRIHELLDELLANPTDGRAIEILSEIRRNGREEFVHCGMIRATFVQRSGMKWEDLEATIGRLQQTASASI